MKSHALRRCLSVARKQDVEGYVPATLFAWSGSLLSSRHSEHGSLPSYRYGTAYSACEIQNQVALFDSNYIVSSD